MNVIDQMPMRIATFSAIWPSRREAHRRLRAALEQNSYADAKRMLKDLEQWLRQLNESAADSRLRKS
jgi:hypothetical protein